MRHFECNSILARPGMTDFGQYPSSERKRKFVETGGLAAARSRHGSDSREWAVIHYRVAASLPRRSETNDFGHFTPVGRRHINS